MTAPIQKLVEQQQALDDFFESLMRDVQTYAESATEPAATHYPPAQPVRPHATPSQTQVVTPVLKPLAIPLPPIAPPSDITPPVVTVPAATPKVIAEAAPAPEPLPAWAHGCFQALLFKVAGLTLAVPLVDLHGVLEWQNTAVTQMPGHIDFYLGLMPYLGRNVALIDTARLVLPADRLRDLAVDVPQQRITRIVLIQDSKYGLACDAIDEVITLKPDDVRWRTSRTQRRWLAGTVVAHMCALIDATAFAQMLADKMPVKAFRE
ncbi:MAG: chemotaxis protein CheW [Gammaproteobacteria bacterium]|nr:chemotaxis protein CheW [Gammaproteobacteria bacterium]